MIEYGYVNIRFALGTNEEAIFMVTIDEVAISI